jgi:hypothetical protein
VFSTLVSVTATAGETVQNLRFEFCGDTISVPVDAALIRSFNSTPTQESVQEFYSALDKSNYQPAIMALTSFRDGHKLNDWIYYQLIRKTAQQISPKVENYERYTLYKWFLLSKSGYDARLGIADNRLLFYVLSNDNIYNIPYYMSEGRQYVCLNIHDYAAIDIAKYPVVPVELDVTEGKKAFSYRITQMPDFAAADYTTKDLGFSYNNRQYHFKVRINPQVKTMFTNYPVVDYESYFNIPLSKETHSSLIPLLKEEVKNMKQLKGVDYLMQFTRNAFLYEDDNKVFGKEKRMSPEQTLLHEYSDCDDRAALFYYLVKEVYDLPMIAVLYPTHITIAVKFDKPTGETIEYNGSKYSLCEPTPQLRNQRIGQVAPEFRNVAYQVAFEYTPGKK